jgi:alcohol dehydrogenase/propanol-preferring alcohol dehydrogenase
MSERVRLVQTGWETPLVHETSADAPPAPTGNQVLVEVEACGICHRDLLERTARFPFQVTPITPGHEAVGRVVAVGPEAHEFRVGDRVATMHRDSCGACDQCKRGETSLCEAAGWVFAILVDGGYAQHLLAPESALYPVPADIAATDAAPFHCTFGTAYRDLATLARVEKGERVLIVGANGGVGSAAIQIALRLGAEVYATVRSEAHVPFVRELGAHHVVVADGGTIHQSLGTRVDAALDTVGAATFLSALRALRVGGRIVTIGNIVMEKVPLNLGYIITSGLTIHGGSGATRREMKALFALHAEQPFRVPIDRVLPLAQADEGQRVVRAGGLRGRVVLVPQAK